jgi:Mn-dependent DtxR family transcriptional regulator
MPTGPAPAPSKSAERFKEYLEIIKKAQEKQGFARRQDIYRRAGNEAQTDREIRRLRNHYLIEGDNHIGYRLTKKGEIWLGVLIKHRELVGLLTKELSGDRAKS